ncbi:MAG: glycosyltransferase [Muribaculaceae bacterium]|nr:glycosyltransferase [Muribaculaceae bacterium]
MVDIIIPAYNVEDYIGQCLESILSQSYTDYNIIVVDDGSTDSTPDIVRQYSVRHDNIKLIIQQNAGQSAARNKGLRDATGDYIVYIDSDDWLTSNDALEKMVRQIETTDADFVQCSFEFVNEDKNTTILIKDEQPALGKDILRKALTVTNIYTSPWAKIYKRKFLIDNNLYFIEGLVNEDTGMSIISSAKATKVSFLPDIVYSSRERIGSTSRSSYIRMFKSMNQVLEITEEQLKEEGVYDREIELLFKTRYVRSMLYNLLQSAQRNDYSLYKEEYEYCFKNTSYPLYLEYNQYLPIPHRLMSSVSKSSFVFFYLAKFMKILGFRMH